MGVRHFLIHCATWVSAGAVAYYILEERGTIKLKEKLEKDGVSLGSREREVERQMSKLRSSPSNLTEVRAITTKERLDMAEKNTVYAVQPSEDEKSAKK